MTCDAPRHDRGDPVPLDDSSEVELVGRWRDALLGSGPFTGQFTRRELTLVSKADRQSPWRHALSLAMYQLLETALPPPTLSAYATSRWPSFLDIVRRRCRSSASGDVLVSLVFCHPESLVLRDLKSQYAYVNHRSGADWDLHVAGYQCPSRGRPLPPSLAGVPLWRFTVTSFDQLRTLIQRAHAKALITADAPYDTVPWRYSGRPELVSFMAYRDFPGTIDWLSLRAVRLVDTKGDYLDRSLGEIVEVLSDWREHDDDALRDLAPGEPPRVVSAWPIRRALQATAAAITGGIAGNAAYDLIKAVVR